MNEIAQKIADDVTKEIKSRILRQKLRNLATAYQAACAPNEQEYSKEVITHFTEEAGAIYHGLKPSQIVDEMIEIIGEL